MQHDVRERASRSPEWLALGLFLLSFTALGLYYTLTNPLYSKPDEYFHYAFTAHLLEGRGLPAVDLSTQGVNSHPPVQQEGHQPPLYYATVAGIAKALNFKDRWTAGPNPHFLGTAVGNRSPWSPYLVAPAQQPIAITGRLLSLLCGLLALLFAYLLFRQFIDWPLALAATALIGWTPQFVYIATSFSNDMASVATINLGLWLLGLALLRGLTLRRALAIGAVIGMATLVKIGGLGLLAPLGLIALWEAWRTRRVQPLLWAAAAGAVVLAIDGWWFWRNWQLYHDPFTTSLLTILLGERSDPVTADVVRDLLSFLWKAYWLDFSPGGILFADAAVYWVIGGVALLALVGAIIAFVRRPAVRPLLILTWGWFGLVLLSFLRMTLSTSIFMGGGRLLFPAATAVGATAAIGLYELAGRRWYAPAAAAAGLGLFAIVAPAIYLNPVYPLPTLTKTLAQPPAQASGTRFGDNAFTLLGYTAERHELAPGKPGLRVTYYWQTQQGVSQDLTLFLQLVSPGAAGPTAQVDTFPTYGALPTRLWSSDNLIVDQIYLPLPASADSLSGRLITGLYDPTTMVRLAAYDRAGQRLPDDAVVLGSLENGQMAGK